MRDAALRLLSAGSLGLLAPVLVAQGRRVRRITPRLPPAGGPSEGTTGSGANPLRLLIVGESTAVGVGVATHAAGLAGHMAGALAAATGRPVAWRVLGRSGASARKLLDEFIAPAPPLDADLVVVALGVNDTISLSSVAHWLAALDALLASLRRAAHTAPVVLSAVPPMEHFPALPSPLRQVLGLRARVLDRAAIDWAGRHHAVIHVPHPRALLADLPAAFCADGFHPSAGGYAQWAAALASAAAPLLKPA